MSRIVPATNPNRNCVYPTRGKEKERERERERERIFVVVFMLVSEVGRLVSLALLASLGACFHC